MMIQHHVPKKVGNMRIGANHLRRTADHFKADGGVAQQLPLLRVARHEAGARRTLELIDLPNVVEQDAGHQKIAVHAEAIAGCGVRQVGGVHRVHEKTVQVSMVLNLRCGNGGESAPVLPKDVKTYRIEIGVGDAVN